STSCPTFKNKLSVLNTFDRRHRNARSPVAHPGSHGANIGLYVATQTNVEGNIERIKRGTRDNYGGVENPHKIPMLPKDTEPQIPPPDKQSADIIGGHGRVATARVLG